MSISSFPLGAEGQYPTFDPHRRPDGVGRLRTLIQCHCSQCGYDPPDVFDPPAACPKCHGSSFVRSPVPGSLLSKTRSAE